MHAFGGGIGYRAGGVYPGLPATGGGYRTSSNQGASEAVEMQFNVSTGPGAGGSRGEVRRSRAGEINAANHRPVSVHNVGHVHSSFGARFGGNPALGRYGLGFDAGVGIQGLQLPESVRRANDRLHRSIRIVVQYVEADVSFVGRRDALLFRHVTVVVGAVPDSLISEECVMIVVV